MIVEFMYRSKVRLKEWMLSLMLRPSAPCWLFFFSVIESSVFPIPPDVLLTPMIISGHSRPYWLAFLTTFGSVLGGILGYAIGALFFDVFGAHLVELYNLQERVALVGSYFDRNAFIAVFLSAFTPIPYKVFTIASGLFSVSFAQFVVASIFGRGARFYLEAWTMKKYGRRLGNFFFRYFNLVTLFFACFILIWLIAR
ncbi:MAG: YqaA family protein [bacterium]|nr:YqaA family protein [bacterium]